MANSNINTEMRQILTKKFSIISFDDDSNNFQVSINDPAVRMMPILTVICVMCIEASRGLGCSINRTIRLKDGFFLFLRI